MQNLFASKMNILSGALTVLPGDKTVRRGSDVVISAQTPESTMDQAMLYFSSRGEEWASENMTFESPGRFSHRLFNVEDTLRYYVRVGSELSSIFRLTPAEAPVLKSIRLTYRYPAALELPTKSVSGSGDIVGPVGAKVEVRAAFSESLANASVQVGDQEARPARVLRDTLVSAEIEIKEDTFYRLQVTGINGIDNEPMDYFIRVQHDEPPEISLRRPGGDVRVTMLEEVTVEAGVVEDHALQKFDLVYTINNGAPQRETLLSQARHKAGDGDGSRPRGAEYVAGTTLYLENYKVEPGDFISFYIEAADRRQTQMSDIYFLEVRPFEEEYHLAVSQGSAGSGLQSSLAISQKEIIAATWKLDRERQRTPPEELKRKAAAIAEAQRGVQETVERMRAISAARQQAGGKMGEYFERAIEAMRRAAEKLEAVQLSEALSPEREAYIYLLKAEAEVRRRDLQWSASNSGAHAQSQEELQRLFADELDKMQSKYETLQNNQRREEEQRTSEALDMVRELARRQQQLNDMNRDLARRHLPEEEKRRQLARLQRQQEELKAQANELSRRLQDLQRSRSSSADRDNSALNENLKEIRDDMSRATNNLNRENPDAAQVEGRRAVERLERLEEQLRRSASQSLRQKLADLKQDIRNLTEAQRELADELAQSGSTTLDPDQGQIWQQTQQRLRARVDELTQQLQQAGRQAQKDPRTSRIGDGLRALADDLRKSEVQSHMEQAGAALAENRLADGERQQRQALRELQKAEADLNRLQSLVAESEEERLDVALQQTQDVRRDLERQLQEQRSTPGRQMNREGANAPGAAEASRSQQQLRPEELNWWRERVWQALDQLEKIKPSMKGDSALAQSFSSLQGQLNGVVRSFRGGDAQRLTDIEEQIIDPLRRFEAELAMQLALAQQRQRLTNAQDEQVPEKYREMVERYYEELSRRKNTNKK
jgi:hypothetical protein